MILAGGPPPAPSDPRQGLPPGWIAEWDAPDNRWFYVNQRTGERSWNRPPGGPPPPGATTYTQVSSTGPVRGPGYQYQQTQVVSQTAPHGAPAPAPAPAAKNHNVAYGAAGAAGGLVAGALLMHEGEKVSK